VSNVSWADAVAFCQWLSERENTTYRLPTEAEWEFACRAGTTTWYASGDRDETLAAVANLADAALREKHPAIEWTEPWNDGFAYTAPTGRFQPNAFGLHDMHGNAWEWCADWYEPTYYRRAPVVDPRGPEFREGRDQGYYHVFRGGGWDNYPGFCRSADRYSSHSATIRTDWAGFRVVREVPVQNRQALRPPLKTFTPRDATIARNLSVTDGAWFLDSTQTQTVKLFELPNPGAANSTLIYQARLKTEDLQGRAYLEMWCRFPGKGEYFSRGFDSTVTGTTDWTTCETPFILRAGEVPDQIRLNVVVEGKGRIWIEQVQLLQGPLLISH
jgi:hypothetical protein